MRGVGIAQAWSERSSSTLAHGKLSGHVEVHRVCALIIAPNHHLVAVTPFPGKKVPERFGRDYRFGGTHAIAGRELECNHRNDQSGQRKIAPAACGKYLGKEKAA